MRKDIVDKFSALMANDLDKDVITQMKQLITDFRDETEKEEQEHLNAFLQDPENERTDYVPAPDLLSEEFEKLVEIFNEKKKQFSEAKALEERQNLEAREKVIAEMASLTQNEENIGKAFSTFNELRERWKAIGRVPGDKHQDIMNAYHAAVDNFYYHIRIYKDLKDLDLKKNLEHKREIIDKIRQLEEKQNIREVEETVKILQNEWFELGPVPRESFEGLRADFTAACDVIYQRIKSHYAKVKEQLTENLTKKQSLVDRARNIDTAKLDSHKSWQKATEKMIGLQEEWKSIGFGPKKENEDIWQEFRAICDHFFKEKKKFYDELNKEFEVNRARKEELCELAEALQNNSNWKDTADKLVKLQQKWKTIGSAGQKYEQKLWNRFRAACNAFFDAKKNHFAGHEEKLQENLLQKLSLLEKIKAYTATADKEENINTIKGFTREWNAIGHVPRNEMARINDEYQKVINAKFEESGIDKDELEYSKFITRIQSFLGEEDAENLLRRERRSIDDKIRELEHQVIQMETNLGFFSKSKGAEKMLKDVINNISRTKNQIKRLDEQKKIMSRMQREKEKAEQQTKAEQE